MFKARKKEAKAGFRLFFATDVHGSDRCFKKFLAAAEVYGADTLVLGGDVGGKAIVPIEELKDGKFAIELYGERTVVPASELEAALLPLRDSGLYPRICSQDEVERLGADEAYREKLFRDEICAQVKNWCDLAAERLPEHVSCIITPGNDDPIEIDEVLREASAIACPEEELFALGPVFLASLGTTTRTPWSTEREADEEDLRSRIDNMLAASPEGASLVFNFHCPPRASGLDTVQALDDELRPIVRNGSVVEDYAGSEAVREAILEYEPTVGLHGHVHEGVGMCKIGKSICINPGSDYGSGILKGAIVQFDSSGRYRDFLLTNG